MSGIGCLPLIAVARARLRPCAARPGFFRDRYRYGDHRDLLLKDLAYLSIVTW